MSSILIPGGVNTPTSIVVPELAIPNGDVPVSVVTSTGVSTVTLSVTSPVSGVRSFTFTPHVVGLNYLVYNNAVIAVVDAAKVSATESLEILLDIGLGSWKYDKAEGEMTLYTQEGNVLRVFTVKDTTAETSRITR